MPDLEQRHDKHGRAWTRISLDDFGRRDSNGHCCFRVIHPTDRSTRLAMVCAEWNVVAYVDTQKSAKETGSTVLVTTCGHRAGTEIFCLGGEKICTACMAEAISLESPMRQVKPEAA